MVDASLRASMEVKAGKKAFRASARLDSASPFPHPSPRLSRERSGPDFLGNPQLGAEGATAPETLRQKDRDGLTNAGK
jgi:hypothetical protein